MRLKVVETNDFVYWPEVGQCEDGKWKYRVCSGYYLATYYRKDSPVHIVTLGQVTSSVVRHLTPDDIFTSEVEAQKRADELNGLTGRDK